MANFLTASELRHVESFLNALNEAGARSEISLGDVDVVDSNGEKVGTIGVVNTDYVFKVESA
jgi:hypothetical protein